MIKNKIKKIFWPTNGKKPENLELSLNNKNQNWEPGQIIIVLAEYFWAALLLLLFEILLSLLFTGKFFYFLS